MTRWCPHCDVSWDGPLGSLCWCCERTVGVEPRAMRIRIRETDLELSDEGNTDD